MNNKVENGIMMILAAVSVVVLIGRADGIPASGDKDKTIPSQEHWNG